MRTQTRSLLVLGAAAVMLWVMLTAAAHATITDPPSTTEGGPPIVGQIDPDGGISPGDIGALPGCGGFCMPREPGGGGGGTPTPARYVVSCAFIVTNPPPHLVSPVTTARPCSFAGVTNAALITANHVAPTSPDACQAADDVDVVVAALKDASGRFIESSVEVLYGDCLNGGTGDLRYRLYF